MNFELLNFSVLPSKKGIKYFKISVIFIIHTMTIYLPVHIFIHRFVVYIEDHMKINKKNIFR